MSVLISATVRSLFIKLYYNLASISYYNLASISRAHNGFQNIPTWVLSIYVRNQVNSPKEVNLKNNVFLKPVNIYQALKHQNLKFVFPRCQVCLSSMPAEKHYNVKVTAQIREFYTCLAQTTRCKMCNHRLPAVPSVCTFVAWTSKAPHF